MFIVDSIIREKLKNVYFIWGSGKTTIANRLNEKYGFMFTVPMKAETVR